MASPLSFRSGTPSQQEDQRRSSGFTILELLIVLTLLLVLGSFTLTIIQKVRQHSRQTQCITHLRTLYLAHMTWMADHQQTLPLGYEDGNYLNYASSDYQQTFAKYLPSGIRGRYTGGSGAYLCPEDPSPRGTDGLPGYFGYSYAVNAFMAVRNQKYAARWTTPSETFLLADGITTLIYGNDSFPERIGWRHSARANFIFLDGHCRPLRKTDIPRPTTLTPFWNSEYVPR